MNARKEGKPALRNLANSAKVLKNNPSLMLLRMLQAPKKGSGKTYCSSPAKARYGIL